MKFKCLICQSGKFYLIADHTRDSDQKIFKCQSCSHLQIFPLPIPAVEKKFYDQDRQTKLIYRNFNLEDFQRRAWADTQRRIGKIKNSFSSKTSLLDIGCGYGFFVKALKDEGFKAQGLEISQERRAIAEKLIGNPVFSFKIAGSNKTKNKFDVITMFHVLEHITEPIKLCTDLKTYLKPNGTLIIEVPNANDYLLKINKNYRDFFWQKAHTSYFTLQPVKMVLVKADYHNIKITGVQRYGFENAINWLRNGKPQLDLPTYQTVKDLMWLERYYKNYLTQKLICDTLWIEAKL